jgi:pilus assembly protein Flp/PilA
MLTQIRRALRREDGATAVEYGLMVVAIAAVIVVVVFTLGKVTQSQFSVTCAHLANQSDTISVDSTNCPTTT